MIRVSVKKKLGDFSLDVDFEAPDGVTILYGPSGSGKTTLLRTVSGIVRPDQGCIALDDTTFFDSARGIDVPIQHRRIGYVFQNAALFPHMTALQNVAYGARSPGQAEKLLALFGMAQAAGQYPRQLSGGESQRVALARALASEPALMLFDEPLSALDSDSRARVLAEIQEAQSRAGIPFLYVTHQASEAHALGHHAVILERGRIARQGPPLDVI